MDLCEALTSVKRNKSFLTSFSCNVPLHTLYECADWFERSLILSLGTMRCSVKQVNEIIRANTMTCVPGENSGQPGHLT